MTDDLQAKRAVLLDGQELMIIGSALMEQAARCKDNSRAQMNRLIAAKIFEVRKQHHAAAGAVLSRRYNLH